MRGWIRCLSWTLACLVPLGSRAADEATPHLREVTLIADTDRVEPGQTLWLGLTLVHEPQWHTYWVNPGDSGLPTKLSWTLPAGYRAGAIVWPTPKRFTEGGITNFGYDGTATLLVPVQVPADAAIGHTLRLATQAKWLVCHEECVPGKADLAVKLTISAPSPRDASARTEAAHARLLAARERVPQTPAWSGFSALHAQRIEVTLHSVDRSALALRDAFALQANVVANAPPTIEQRGSDLVLTFAQSDYFTSIPAAFDLLLVGSDGRAWLVSAPFARSASSPSTAAEKSP